MIALVKQKYNPQHSSRYLNDLYLVPPRTLVVAAEPLEELVQEVSGGPEGDQEPAQHHRDGPGQVHCLIKKKNLIKIKNFVVFFLWSPSTSEFHVIGLLGAWPQTESCCVGTETVCHQSEKKSCFET